MKPWQKIDKKFVQEADHVEKAYNAVMMVNEKTKSYSDDEWAKDRKTTNGYLEWAVAG